MNFRKLIIVVSAVIIMISCDTLKEMNLVKFTNESSLKKEITPDLSNISRPQRSDPGTVKSWAFQKLLIKAIKSNDLVGVKKYLELGANPNWGEDDYQPKSAMYYAASKGCKECVKLMAPKADFNFSWKQVWYLPIAGAAKHSKEMLVFMVENFNINVNASSYGRFGQENALAAIVSNSKPGCVEYLLSKGVNPNFGSPTPWYDYVFGQNIKNGTVGEVNAFIAAKANLNISSSRATVLGEAIDMKRTDLAKLLLSAGAKPNHCDSEKETSHPAIYFAIDRNDYEITKLLIEKGSTVNARRYEDCRPEGSLLDYASEQREIDSRIIDLLVGKGAR